MIEAVLPSLPGEEVRIITHMPEKGEKEEAWMLLEIKTMGSFIYYLFQSEEGRGWYQYAVGYEKVASIEEAIEVELKRREAVSKIALEYGVSNSVK